jgi:hypothetical protein
VDWDRLDCFHAAPVKRGSGATTKLDASCPVVSALRHTICALGDMIAPQTIGACPNRFFYIIRTHKTKTTRGEVLVLASYCSQNTAGADERKQKFRHKLSTSMNAGILPMTGRNGALPFLCITLHRSLRALLHIKPSCWCQQAASRQLARWGLQIVPAATMRC